MAIPTTNPLRRQQWVGGDNNLRRVFYMAGRGQERFNCPIKNFETRSEMDIGKINGEIDIWEQLKNCAEEALATEPALSEALHSFVMEHKNFPAAMCSRITHKLANNDLEYRTIISLCREAFEKEPEISCLCQNDIIATKERDPACESVLTPFLWYKGFLAISTHRIAHYFWTHSRQLIARFLQSKVSEKLGVDIHPAARFGCGILLDHATSFVAGETSVVENNVSILHDVTLGGTGKERGERHPKIRAGVLIGAGAKILGNIEVGTCAKIGAGSVVLDDVPPYATVTGVPARIVCISRGGDPAGLMMNHKLPKC